MKRVLVCGGRDFVDADLMARVLDALAGEVGEFMVIHGGASGADSLAGDYARRRGLPEVIVPAAWATHGKSAGPVRNAWMLDLQPHHVVAFPGGKGTADMVRRARRAQIDTTEVTA